MRAWRCAAALLAAALLLLASAAPAGQPFAPGVVLDITIENFDQEARQKHCVLFIRSRARALKAAPYDAQVAKGPLLLYIGADWCPHCERLKPVWSELAPSLRGVVAVARVDGPPQRALSARLGVRGYPTIYLFRDGSMREFNGQLRNAAALTHWATKAFTATPKAPLLRTPNNALGRALGLVFRLPSATAAARDAAKKALGVGDAALAALAAVAALVAAGASIFALDCALALSAGRTRPHQA